MGIWSPAWEQKVPNILTKRRLKGHLAVVWGRRLLQVSGAKGAARPGEVAVGRGDGCERGLGGRADHSTHVRVDLAEARGRPWPPRLLRWGS